MSRTPWAAWPMFLAAVATNLALLFWPRSIGDGGIPHLDKVGHALSFAWVMASGVRAGMAAWALGAVLAAHAVVSEVVQHTLLTGRSGDPADVVADLGGLGAVAVALGAASWRHGRGGRRDGSDGGVVARR